MTALQILDLITAADATLARSIAIYRDVRDTLASEDIAAIDSKLAALQAANDADFILVDAKLARAAAD